MCAGNRERSVPSKTSFAYSLYRRVKSLRQDVDRAQLRFIEEEARAEALAEELGAAKMQQVNKVQELKTKLHKEAETARQALIDSHRNDIQERIARQKDRMAALREEHTRAMATASEAAETRANELQEEIDEAKLLAANAAP